MKLLYIHDNVYFQSDFGKVYSQGQFPYTYFTPFVDTFSELTVIGRGQPLNKNLDVNKLNLSSGPDIDFILVPNINSPLGMLKNYRVVNEIVREQVAQADAIILRAVSDLGWLGYQHAQALKKPIAMEMSACAWDSTWNHGHPLSKIYAPIRYIRDKIICSHSDYVLYVSQNFLQNRYHTHGHAAVASNVRISIPELSALEKRLDRINRREDDDMIVIGLIGTLSHKLKGIHTALDALQSIENKMPGKFIFKILGPGDPAKYRRYATQKKLDHVVFFDGVIQSGDEVLRWLDGIDIYIQPSYQEGVPRATIEAMSRGCPVIGSTAGGIPELLPPEWLHKPGQSQTLAHLLQAMMMDKSLQQEAAQHNFEKSKFYSAEQLMPIRRSFWQGFADHARRRMPALEFKTSNEIKRAV